MTRALVIACLFLVVHGAMPSSARAQSTHPLLREAESLREDAATLPQYLHGISNQERDDLALRLHEAAGHEHDPETRRHLHESAIALYTDFHLTAPSAFVDAFMADARAIGDYDWEVAAFEVQLRLQRNLHPDAETLFAAFDELEALLQNAPPESADQYAVRARELQAEYAANLYRYRSRHEMDEATRTGRTAEALRRYEAYFEQADSTDSNYLSHRLNQAEAYESAGRPDRAAAAFLTAYEHALEPSGGSVAPTPWRITPSMCYDGYLRNIHGGDSAAYREAFQHYLLNHPPDRTTHRSVTRLVGEYMDQGNYEQAIPLLERWVELNPDGLLPHFRLGTVLMLAGRTDEAEAVFERIRTMAGRENTFVLMAENELHAIRGGRRSGESWWQSALDRVVDFSAAAEPGHATARSVDTPPRAAMSEPQQSPSTDGPGLLAPLAMGTIAVLVALLFLAARRV